jgi:hypothetical protein
MSSAMTMM